MVVQSKWMVSEEGTNPVRQAITLKPRLDCATNLVDKILEVLVKKRLDLDRKNLNLYAQINDNKHKIEFQSQMLSEIEISRSIESLRQARRCLDSVFGLGNILLALAPTIPIVRTVRSQLFELIPETDTSLGELSLLLGSLIVDVGHLTGAIIDFDEANQQSVRLLDEAKLIADSKIYKQFPNVDFL